MASYKCWFPIVLLILKAYIASCYVVTPDVGVPVPGVTVTIGGQTIAQEEIVTSSYIEPYQNFQAYPSYPPSIPFIPPFNPPQPQIYILDDSGSHNGLDLIYLLLLLRNRNCGNGGNCGYSGNCGNCGNCGSYQPCCPVPYYPPSNNDYNSYSCSCGGYPGIELEIIS